MIEFAFQNSEMDEIFQERITRENSSAKQENRARMRAIKEHQTMTKSLDDCSLCIDSEKMLKHTIVSAGSKIFLSLPYTLSLVAGQCILSMIRHVPCQDQLDEDYFSEIKVRFCVHEKYKLLVKSVKY